MNTQKPLTRKQRRALQFGTVEQRTEVLKQIEPRKPFYVQEIMGTITIPYIGKTDDVRSYVWHNLPDQYYSANASVDQSGTAKDVKGYAQMVTKWFFCGLQVMTPIFKSIVVAETEDGKIANDPAFVLHAFNRYLSFVLNDWGLKHEHKMAFAAYICETCCTEIFWMEK